MTTAAELEVTGSGKNGAQVLKKVKDLTGSQRVTITAPNFQIAEFNVTGTAPYVQLRFSMKARTAMREKQEAGQQATKGKKRAARNFADDYAQAMYQSSDGWRGIPAASFGHALVSVCRMVDFKMTIAKMSLFVLADGMDKDDGTPLVKIVGKPHACEHAVRNATGVADLRVRAMWDTWSAKVRVRYDADQFSLQDVTNLMMRAGMNNGIGEGRPNSKMSIGMGWGTFSLDGKGA